MPRSTEILNLSVTNESAAEIGFPVHRQKSHPLPPWQRNARTDESTSSVYRQTPGNQRERERERETARKNLSVKNKEVILGGLGSLTFPQHIAVAMATAVLRVATRVCERERCGWEGSVRIRGGGERHTRRDGKKKSGRQCAREREKKQHREEKETEECKKKGRTRIGGGGGGGGREAGSRSETKKHR